MLNRIISFSLNHRLFVVVAAFALSVYGLWTATKLPIDVLPDLNRPTVTVLTEAPGMVPADVERLVTRHIERAVAGAAGVTRVRSNSGPGLSVVMVEFGWGSELLVNRQLVQERLTNVRGQLPRGIQPMLAPIASIMGQIQLVGVRSRSGNTPPSEIRALVDQRVRPLLLSVPGVGQVLATGGAPRELQILVDAESLIAFDVDLHQVAEAIRGAGVLASGAVLPLGAKGPLVTVSGRVRAPEDLEAAVVRHDPLRPVLLRDVAAVRFGPASLRVGDAGVDGGPGVVVVIMKQPGIDTAALSLSIEEELSSIQSTLSEDLEIIPDLFRQADFIHRAVKNVGDAVRDGAILVVIVLMAFLLNLRTTLITLTAIPLSLAVTALVFAAFGISINTMTLGGIAVAIGALVDDAIVDVENVFRRLRQNRERPRGQRRHPLLVIYRASSEVRQPILIGTLVVISVYIPLFALSGMEGRLFTPIGIAYIFSVLASLLVALTVTPVLCSYLLPSSGAVERREGWLVRNLKQVSGRMMRFSIAHCGPIAALLVSLALAGLVILLTRGSEFLPPFNEGTAQVNIILPPGTGIETSNAFARRLEDAVGGVAGVRHLARRTGRAEGDEHVEGVNVTELVISFDPESGREREEILADIRHRVHEALPGVAVEVEQPLAHLLSHLLSGVNAQVAIKVQGPDLQVLRRIAREAAAAIRGIPGVTDLIVEPQVLVENVEVRPRRRELAARGLTVRDLGEQVALALEGAEISRLHLGEITHPIVMRLEEEDRRDLVSLRRLRLAGSDAAPVLLGDVADVGISMTPNNINRENNARRIVVQHNVEGRSLGEVVADVEEALIPIESSLPPGYAIRIGGQFQAQRSATRVVFLLSFASLAAMFLLIYAHFRSANLTLQALASIPMAFIGAVAWILATGQTVSVATLVGLVALGGIATRNSILLIDHYLHLIQHEHESFSKEMIVRAGQERMVPVLMTALTSGIALVPLVLAPGEPGREILYPVASVIIGGLISATLLDLLLTPGLFWTFGRNAAASATAARAQAQEQEAPHPAAWSTED